MLVVKATNQVPAEIVQIGVQDDRNPFPVFVVAKNFPVANDGNNLTRLRIDDIANEHVSLAAFRSGVYNSGFATLFRLPCCRQQIRRDGTLTPSDVRGLTLAIGCEPCDRRGRYNVARLIERHGGEVRMPDFLQTLSDCPKARSLSIYDRCKAVYESK